MTCHASFRFCLALFQLSKLGCFFNGGSEIFVTESLAANDLETPKNSPTHCTWKSLTTSGNSSFFMSFCHQHPNCACMTQQKKIQSNHSAQSLSLVNEHGFWCQAKIGKGGHVTKSGCDWAWRMQLTCLCHSLSLCSELERSCSMDCRREVPATCCKFTWKTVWSDFIHRVDERCDWFLGPKPSKSPSRKHWEQHCNLQPQDVHVCLKNAMLDLSPKFPVASGTKGPTGHVQNYIIETTIVEHPAFCLIFLSDIELIRMSAPEFHVTNQSKWRKCLRTSIMCTVVSTVFYTWNNASTMTLPCHKPTFSQALVTASGPVVKYREKKNLCTVLGY